MGFGALGGGGNRISYETLEEDLESWGVELFGDPTKFITWAASMNPVCANDAGPQVITVPKSLHIPAGVTLTPSNRCKGLYIFVNGHLKIDGTISMTARGASAVGVDTPLNPLVRKERRVTRTIGSQKMITQDLWDQTFGSIGVTPAVGADGGAGATAAPSGFAGGVNGTAGTGRKTGGGGSGRASNGGTSGRGGNGTAFSGGSGGGAGNASTGGAGSDSGGAGGAGAGANTGGGAGNPGGAGTVAGTSGTGGLILIVARGSIWIESTGVISSNGTAGGTTNFCGGGSGGGSINLAYGKSYANLGTIQANGGPSGSGVTPGAGGAGCITIERVSL